MGQSFEYPNLVAGTDVPTAWYEPPTMKANVGVSFLTVDFPRPLVDGDVVATTVTVEADGLDLTAPGGALTLQGQTWMQQGGSTWAHDHPLTAYTEADGNTNYGRAKIARGVVYNGLHHFDNVYHVTSAHGARAPIGAIRCTLECRVDNCGGGRLRVRRLMVTLNGDGVPHAWAPAEGDELSGGGVHP